MFALLLPGCASPPSVVPLLRVADKALTQESQLLDADSVRMTAWVDAQRRSLDDGYAADLTQRGQLDATWVLGGTRAYVAAREALLRHEMALERQGEVRRENLQAASRAIRRAIGVTALQDALFAPIPDLRRIETEGNP